jgi:hypothetical protein
MHYYTIRAIQGAQPVGCVIIYSEAEALEVALAYQERRLTHITLVNYDTGIGAL